MKNQQGLRGLSSSDMLSTHATLGLAPHIHVHLYVHKHSQKERKYHACIQAGSHKIMKLGRKFQTFSVCEEK